jgi:hypothetical protein
MSLRDWFAGQAMPTLLADPSVNEVAESHGVQPRVLLAKLAYQVADAMLAARKAGA